MKKNMLAAALAGLNFVCLAQAAPDLLTYQGRYKESGTAVTGDRSVEIRLCTALTGGTCHSTGAQSVAVTNGLFRSTFSVPGAADISAGDWYLEIAVGVDTLAPRERLASTMYALQAATAAYAATAANAAAAAAASAVPAAGVQAGNLGPSVMASSVAIGSVPDAAIVALSASKLTGALPAIDGSALTGVGGGLDPAGDVMTGQLTLAGSTLTIAGNAFSVGGATLTVYEGLVGIGTASPSDRLEVNGGLKVSNGYLKLDPGYGIFAGSALSHLYYGDYQQVSNGGAEAMRLTAAGNLSHAGVLASSGTGNNYFAGNIGIATAAPQARLDVLASGNTPEIMAQIWRDSDGTIISSMSATGVLKAVRFEGDGSGLSNVGTTYLADEQSLGLTGNTFAAKPSSVTLQGNIFNAANSLVQLDGSARLTALDGSQLLKISSITLAGFYSHNGVRASLGLAIGGDVQAYDADLDAIAALSCAPNQVARWNGSAWACATEGLGVHVATTNVVLGANYLSGDGGSEGIFVDAAGKVGISTGAPEAALDVLSAGNTAADMAQIWRDSDGNVVSSMSATGLLAANSIVISGGAKIADGSQGAGKVLTSDANGAASWQSSAGVPSGAVMYFNLASCPGGWTELTSARGRYMVGLPSGGTLAGTAGTELTNLENRSVGEHNHGITDPGHIHSLPAAGSGGASLVPSPDVSTGSSPNSGSSTTGITINNAGAVAGTNAPYIQLLVCQKD